MRSHARFLLAALLCPGGLLAAADDRGYDPLAVSGERPPAPTDLTVLDRGRNREIPIRVYLPAGTKAAPVVLFSHGLGGSREGYAYLGRHWAARGYVAVFLQHPGSDSAVWKDKPAAERMSALRRAASAENFLLRAKDVPAVIDQLGAWAKADGHPLRGRMDLTRIGMAGHSFGAVTTQAVSGQSFPGGRALFTDPRITAAVALSPSGPRQGSNPWTVFGGVKIPWAVMTGTHDVSPIGDIDVKSRLSVFPALPPGGKYELVLDGAEHSAFSDSALPGDRRKRNPNHHKAILAISTAFWDAYLRGDAAARKWLDGDGPRSVLDKADGWKKK